MFKKISVGFVSLSLLVALVAFSNQGATVNAHGASSSSVNDDGDTFDVAIQVTGVVVSITPQSSEVSIVVLDDGTTLLVNPDTVGAENLVVGQSITVIGELGATTTDLSPKTITPAPAAPPE